MSEEIPAGRRRQMNRVVEATDKQAGLCQHCREPYKPSLGEALCRDCIESIATAEVPGLSWWLDVWLYDRLLGHS